VNPDDPNARHSGMRRLAQARNDGFLFSEIIFRFSEIMLDGDPDP
jgi:hypothetical protein